MLLNNYIFIGLSVLALISLFAYFSDDANGNYDYSGIIHDVRQSTSGYIFYIDTGDDDIRCFYDEKPVELGHYSIRGSFSQDEKIFFLSDLIEVR
jgi:hypothetical protein